MTLTHCLTFQGVFDDDFLDYLFDLVEQTRHMQDEAFNYSVICLIVREIQHSLHPEC